MQSILLYVLLYVSSNLIEVSDARVEQKIHMSNCKPCGLFKDVCTVFVNLKIF